MASNDGYLLKNFVAAGIPCLGIEPTASTAIAAEKLGVPVMREFFGEQLGRQLAAADRQADLIAGNNVYAHVPDINDFTRGLKRLLKPGGTVTFEFPHLMRLLEHTQFDTVYHEHFSYLSLFSVGRIFESAGLRVFDVEELPTHGGSLRVYGCHADEPRQTSPAVAALLAEEARRGLQASLLSRLSGQSESRQGRALGLPARAKRAGKAVAGYGAAAKGNTLLNYAGVKPDLLPFVCRCRCRQARQVHAWQPHPDLRTAALLEHRPDYVIILPWNLKAEVTHQLAQVRDWGGKFVTAVPVLEVSR